MVSMAIRVRMVTLKSWLHRHMVEVERDGGIGFGVEVRNDVESRYVIAALHSNIGGRGRCVAFRVVDICKSMKHAIT